MLIKHGFLGGQNGYMVTRGGDFETRSCCWQLLVEIILRLADGVCEFDTVQKTQVLRDEGTCLKPHRQWPPGSIWDA